VRLALQLVRAVLLAPLIPILVLIPAVVIGLADIAWILFGRRRPANNRPARHDAASVVIPNWNGRDLLEKYLPPLVEAMMDNPRNEIIVVDNGSTDGSADFVRTRFPSVKLLALPTNLGFGGGCNAGFRAASNDIAILLNNDMRVDRDFLAPLLAPFADPAVFGVSCQILFSDAAKKREESGLTQGWWQDGALRVRHRVDDLVTEPFPCFYPGGGSAAIDRAKFSELGGFDELLRPFYGEDTDLGYLAWKRGWKVLYQPQSLVWHEHRGTIGKTFSPAYINGVVDKNFILLCWKNVHRWGWLASHFFFAAFTSLVSLFSEPSRERYSVAGLARAFAQLPTAIRSRWRARRLAQITDPEALRRHLPAYYRDRFGKFDPNRTPRVLLAAPYPIEPQVHGGAVFMGQTVRALAEHTDIHLAVLLEQQNQLAAHDAIRPFCASADFLVRPDLRSVPAIGFLPNAIREFSSPDIEWLIHREILRHEIDVLQLEYTHLGQYAGDFHRLLNCVFEHDVYFQSVSRVMRSLGGYKKIAAVFEYLRALRWELRMLRRVDQIQVCTRENAEYLASFDPELAARIYTNQRAAIDVARYPFHTRPRAPGTILFVGSFRHQPNAEALHWFLANVFPHILAERPAARLIVAGSDPPAAHLLPYSGERVELRGQVPSVIDVLTEASVFVCPILSGSGVRVKLLEAFATGIPTVSTRIGAEGLARNPGEFCRLADDGAEFAHETISLLDQGDADMVARARQEVEMNWDIRSNTRRLLESYRSGLRAKLTRSLEFRP
jgi:GT2 family glycosyltransferase/glycosyltransferase involved in cell wall biosynthesis